jgi:protein gp37
VKTAQITVNMGGVGMSLNKTKIAWTDFTWNPVTGCSPISEGCQNCYAEKAARRFYKTPEKYKNRINQPFFEVTTHPDRLAEPLKRKKPAKIFLCSMGDLFHDEVPDEFIRDVWIRMSWSSRHTFQILTKRPYRMFNLINRFNESKTCAGIKLPLPNVWLGVTVENQQTADERIPLLLQTPAAKRFVSCEPLLGNIELSPEAIGGYPSSDEWARTGPKYPRLDWVIVGGETGPNARLCRESWVADIYDQCRAAKVPFFFKNYGRWWERHADWWCEHCQQWVPPEAVTFEETHDERCGGCGQSVHHSGFFNWEELREWPKSPKKRGTA